jgi:hypothetical protein
MVRKSVRGNSSRLYFRDQGSRSRNDNAAEVHWPFWGESQGLPRNVVPKTEATTTVMVKNICDDVGNMLCVVTNAHHREDETQTHHRERVR